MDRIELLQSLEERGFSKPIISAFSKVKREKFVPSSLKSQAYLDTALPIGQGQTISQPYTIAMMLKLLGILKGQKVLEIGSGCGYVLALLSEIVSKEGKVFGIEIVKELAGKSKENLRRYSNVKVYNKNGAQGLKEEAPFDRILISAALEGIPEPLFSQLKEGGILVAPVGDRYGQSLVAFQRKKNKFRIIREIPGFIFVPFVNKD